MDKQQIRHLRKPSPTETQAKKFAAKVVMVLPEECDHEERAELFSRAYNYALRQLANGLSMSVNEFLQEEGDTVAEVGIST